MRIVLDVCVAVVALQAAVNAGAEGLAVDCDAVAGRVLHGLVRMARQAIRLCVKDARPERNQQCEQPNGRHSRMDVCMQSVPHPLAQAQGKGNQECCDSCGFGHSAVFFLHVEVRMIPLLTWLPAVDRSTSAKRLLAGIAPLRKVLCKKTRSDRGHNCMAINQNSMPLSRDLQHFGL